MKKLCCVALCLLGLAAPGQISYTPWIPIFKGIDRASGTNSSGYTGGQQIVQAMRIDLQDPDVRLFTTPPVTNNWVANSRETLSQTPGTFMKANKLKVAINGAHYQPSSYNGVDGVNEWIHGLVVSQGQFVSPSDGSYGMADSDALMYFNTNMAATFIPYNYARSDDTNGMYICIPGMYALVAEGVNVSYGYLGQGNIHQPQPRTAIGYSQDNRYLIFVVIDGRQSDSDGAVDYETANWLITFGAYNGMNLDGGGSTCMVMANDCGDPVILNDPSIKYSTGGSVLQRSVGHNIGIYARSLPTVFMQDADKVPGHTTAILQWNTASPASTQVEYGRTSALGTFSPLDSTPRTNHTVVLTGLTPGVSNYFRLISVAGVPYSTPICSFQTLSGIPGANMTLLFDVTQTWSYTTNNLDGVAWTAKDYSESGWQGSGPGLLYVEDSAYVSPKNTPLPSPCGPGIPGVNCGYQIPRTYYFRTHFTFPSNPGNITLSFTNWIDDGAVFYLNGVEINRVRMFAAPTVIYNNTLANGFTPTPYPSSDPRYGDAILDYPTVFTLSGPVITTNLVQGDNVMAVEVHNYSAGSPDIVFGTLLYYSGTPNSLVVMATDVNMAIPVTISPNDNYGSGAGITPCERSFGPSVTPTVTTAPTNATGQVFRKWQLDGVDYSNNLTTSVSMATNHVLVAVYGPASTTVTWTLAVNSSNPNSGVNIAVAPNDLNTNGSGVTPFTRIYTNGSTVTLTAPDNLDAQRFLKWQRDGADYSTNLAINATVDTNRVFTAVYVLKEWTLSVASINPANDVLISVSPPDNGGNSDGGTPFSRTYNHGALVILTAPAASGINTFQKWRKDGVDYSNNRVVSFNLTTNQTLTAVYATPTWSVTVDSSNPDSGVTIGVMVNGIASPDGVTSFNRSYTNGSSVTLTAPATGGTNVFLKWLKGGVDFSTNRVVNFTLTTNQTLTAVYATPTWSLTVESFNPKSGVTIGVTVNGSPGSDGLTPFGRTYTNGTSVTLTAPATGGTNVFLKWLMDGADFSSNAVATVLLDTNRWLTAVYAVPRWTLNIGAEPALDLAVEVQPADVNGDTNGTVPLTRTYLAGALVTVTAPAVVGTNEFAAWNVDGTTNSNTVVTVEMTTNRVLTALYVTPIWTLTINSLEPTNAVPVSIAPNDQFGNGDGATPVVRSYYSGSAVALTAPVAAGDNPFQKWQSGGVDLSTNLTLQLTVRTNTEVTAVFALATVMPPLLTFQRFDNQMVLNWTNLGYTLQLATNLTLLDWSDVLGPVTNGPYTNLMTAPATLFRLKK